MDKIKGFLTKNSTLLTSIGIIILVVIAAIKAYKEYLIVKVTERFIDAYKATDKNFASLSSDANPIEWMKLISSLRSFVSTKSLKQLHSINNLSDAEFISIFKTGKI